MSNLFVLAFDNEAEARDFGGKLGKLVEERLLVLDDAAMVVRDLDGKPHVDEGKHLVKAGALGGAFWGMLFGLIFLMPLFGLAVGAAFGALGGKLGNIGLNKQILEEIGDAIKPGQAGWFILVRQATRDKVLEELAGTNAKVIRTNLSREQEDNLRKAFSGEQYEV